MSELLKRYCPRTEFDSYEDFYENYTCNVPENFNFAYDIVDEWARLDPQKPALVWTNDAGDIKRFTFGDMKRHSDQAANVFAAHGIKKGDVVMLILKQRPEVWMCMVALMKLGAKCIPATYQLTPKDIVYRCNRAQVKMIVCVDDDVVLDHIKNSVDECETLETIATVGTHPHEGLVDFCKELYAASDVFARPTGAEATQNSDPMLIYFSSGTTGIDVYKRQHRIPFSFLLVPRKPPRPRSPFFVYLVFLPQPFELFKRVADLLPAGHGHSCNDGVQ